MKILKILYNSQIYYIPIRFVTNAYIETEEYVGSHEPGEAPDLKYKYEILKICTPYRDFVFYETHESYHEDYKKYKRVVMTKERLHKILNWINKSLDEVSIVEIR